MPQSMTYGHKWPLIAKDWDTMVIKKNRESEFNAIAQKIIQHKDRYLGAEVSTGVPWWMIGVLHMREASGNFNTYLGNGEPLNRKTRLVPKGRGPFSSWQAGADDALRLQGFDKIQDWRIEKVLYQCELYNGLGYEYRKLPSPYVWGGSNHQRAGKYVADSKFSSTTWDSQPGCAPIIAMIAKHDPAVKFVRET